MEAWLWVAVGILLIAVIVLAAKVCALRRGAREIAEGFRERMAEDTNTLIDLSSRDQALCALASEINVQLRLLRQERHRYQQGDRELKEAVTNISHDLRTPLTAICGYLDLLEREETGERVSRYLAQIRSRAEALKGLTEELFRYSVVASAQELQPERVDLVQALEESLLSFYGAMQARGIQPELHLPENPVYRELDANALGRIFANILSNAMKYSDGGLTITMDDGCICFSNPASGLDAVSVGRLFDRFYTVDAGRSSTGLGLSIAKLLTERMGGTIQAEYRAGQLHIQVNFKARMTASGA